jgi:cytochrome c-type biogenesis protein CcmE
VAVTSTGAGPGSTDGAAPPHPPAAPALPLPVVGGPRHRRSWLGSWRRRVVAVVIVAGAIGYLLYQGLSNATVYFRTADQAVADRTQLGTSDFRIEGTVENDVQRVGTDTDFNIYANHVTVSIVASSEPTQLFQPNIPVVLEGHWQGPVFAASSIMVKHSASYTEAHPSRLKPQLPPTTTAPSP